MHLSPLGKADDKKDSVAVQLSQLPPPVEPESPARGFRTRCPFNPEMQATPLSVTVWQGFLLGLLFMWQMLAMLRDQLIWEGARYRGVGF